MASQYGQVSSVLHESVQKGFTDGQHYDNYRPDYTDGTIDEVVRMLGVNDQLNNHESCTVVELGAGTGKFTRKITTKLPENVKYIATEPMSDFLATLQRNCPMIKTMQCAAANTSLGGASVQGIVAAQAFHWFSNNESLDEIHRILDRNGKLVLLWNFNDRNIDWINKMLTRIDMQRSDPCRFHGLEWKSCIDEHPGFEFVEQKISQGTVLEGDVEFILKHCSTHSGLQKLTASDRSKELETIRQLLTTHPETKGSDIIALPFNTDIYLYKKVEMRNESNEFI